MLRFIEQQAGNGFNEKLFQYIPCYGLSTRGAGRTYRFRISIHPMLRFIVSPWIKHTDVPEFQYIPCYGLSRIGSSLIVVITVFQYIPCYGLSFMDIKDFTVILEFQYIPCYGLSLTKKNIAKSVRISIHPMLRFIVRRPERKCMCTDFNTSHVTVYHNLFILYLWMRLNFNTSHVTVYLMTDMFEKFKSKNFNTSHVTVYQDGTSKLYTEKQNFNTSHVTVYRHRQWHVKNADVISIHPMLRFIKRRKKRKTRR